jgi:lauroyl/myristoyl acyltransferase
MNTLIYWAARSLVAVIQVLPLRLVAHIGRGGGFLAYLVAKRYRRLAIKNLALCFPEKSSEEIRQIAIENFRRLGENYGCAIRTAAMGLEELKPYFECVGAEKIGKFQPGAGPQNRIVAIGHFGNFELYARVGQFTPGFTFGATYRSLNQPGLNRVMLSLRGSADCRFFERRADIAALKEAMSSTGLLLGLLADQHGVTGLRLPFFGRECSTSIAPAVFALRYHCPLHTAICYRVGLARWRIETGDEIPTHFQGQPRSVADIMLDVNREFEKAIRRDPANWFWVHRRWKPPGRRVKRVVNGKIAKSTNPV